MTTWLPWKKEGKIKQRVLQVESHFLPQDLVLKVIHVVFPLASLSHFPFHLFCRVCLCIFDEPPPGSWACGKEVRLGFLVSSFHLHIVYVLMWLWRVHIECLWPVILCFPFRNFFLQVANFLKAHFWEIFKGNEVFPSLLTCFLAVVSLLLMDNFTCVSTYLYGIKIGKNNQN